jgi:hypothetical protein
LFLSRCRIVTNGRVVFGIVGGVHRYRRSEMSDESDDLARELPPRRHAGLLPLSLLAFLALTLAALATLLSPAVARADECLSPVVPTEATSAGDDLQTSWSTAGDSGGSTDGGAEVDCGGTPPPPPPPPPPPDPPPPPPPDPPAPPPDCSGAVVLYEHAYYQGQCWSFPVGQIVYVGDAANDRASSIRVADGYVATLYEHGYFGGGSANTFTAADPWGWASVGNDAVSSLVVQSAEPDWTSYYYANQETEAQPQNLTEVAASGCAKVGGGVTHRNIYRRLWRFALLTRFCWNGSTITALWEREVAVNIDAIPFPFSLIQGWRYTPVAFQPGEAGYSSTVLRADGRFDFCSFKYGCITTQQPWVRIELYANGLAYCWTNVRTQPFACERVS